MKRYVAFLLALTFCFCITACRAKNTNEEVRETVEFTETKEIEMFEPEIYEEEDGSGITPLLYKVSDSDSNIWLFGSIHLGTDEMKDLPHYVLDAFYASDALAVECDVKEFEADFEAQMEVAELMMFTDGSTISDHIDTELYESAKQVIDETVGYMPAYDYMLPVMWSSFIESALIEKLGYNADNGIDVTVMELAAENDIELREIESAMFQCGMLAGFSMNLQEYMLAETVRSYISGEYEAQLHEMVEAWCNGEIESILAEADDRSALTREERVLMKEYDIAMEVKRNLKMTDYAVDALENNEETFICVGAAHVVGEGAMAQLLEEKGYTVEIVK